MHKYEKLHVSVIKYICLNTPFSFSANTCTSPQIKSSTYTTTEASSSMNTVFVVQFALTCKNGAKVCITAYICPVLSIVFAPTQTPCIFKCVLGNTFLLQYSFQLAILWPWMSNYSNCRVCPILCLPICFCFFEKSNGTILLGYVPLKDTRTALGSLLQ